MLTICTKMGISCWEKAHKPISQDSKISLLTVSVIADALATVTLLSISLYLDLIGKSNLAIKIAGFGNAIALLPAILLIARQIDQLNQPR